MLLALFVFEHILLALITTVLVGVVTRHGAKELIRVLVVALRYIPGVEGGIQRVLKHQVKNFLNKGKEGTAKEAPRVLLPLKGVSHDELRKEMQRLQSSELSHKNGKIFAYVYTLDNDHFDLQKDCFHMFEETAGHSFDHDLLVKEFHHAFLHENALNPMIFPSLRRFETEIVSMTAGMLNGDKNVVGFLTSGGTESVLMAVKSYRDRARKLFPHIMEPEIVAPVTTHPCIHKAAHYFGLTVKHTPVTEDYTADVKAMEKAVTPSTILIVASAPQFCHGVVDPIPQISDLAIKYGLPLHVDACLGGFMLPWVEKLGYSLPKFDFRVPGVMSMSADIHKYGYGAKGSSVVLYRDSNLRKFQIHSYAEWPGGLYGSPSMAGSRPGGNIAASWAGMMALGENGYVAKAWELMEITNKLKDGICKIEKRLKVQQAEDQCISEEYDELESPLSSKDQEDIPGILHQLESLDLFELRGLSIIGNPHMTVFSVKSIDPDIDILAVADIMEKKEWRIERQQNPDSLHFSILPHLTPLVNALLQDLSSSCTEAKANRNLSKSGTAALYGMMGKIPDKAIITDFIVEFFSEVYS